MDQSPEIGVKFGDLTKEERYKKVERNLKLAFVKQMEQAKAYIDKDYCTSPTWPSLSSINVDNLDTTTGCPSLQVSRVESEVVASSSNLHKMLSMKRNNCVPMATSSVKKFPKKEFDRDRDIMPPPPPVNLMYRNPKIMSEVNTRHNIQNQYGTNNDLENQTYEPKIFQHWKVLLNDHGQLIVKGILKDCGKMARSKPILQRISSNKVQSIYKHIYILDGNIHDERNELPDYVRGKFHNGFPDDWENVYQLWRNFVAKGSKVTFRWPTPITDSDDDIVTEITDFTYYKNKDLHTKESTHYSNSITNNATSSGYHSKSQSDSHQNLEKSNKENIADKNDIMNKKLDALEHSSEMNDSREHENSNKTKDCSNLSINCPNVKYSRYLYEILQEDKLRIIRSNLGDKNCPPQYLDKFIELIDCLRYLLSYTPNNETDSKNQPQNCLKCSSTFSESQEINPEEQSNNVILRSEEYQNKANNAKLVDPSKDFNPQKNYDNHNKVHHDTDIMTDSSDSDAYMGIPKVHANHIFKPKIRSERYKDVKNRIKEKKNTQTNNQTDLVNQSLQNQRKQFQNDSSVSITDDEGQSRQLKTINNETINRIGSPQPFMKRINAEDIKYIEAKKDVESLGASDVNSRSTPKKRVVERPKPIVKSNEPVNIDLKSKGMTKKALPVHSDVSFLDDEVSVKRQKLSHVSNNDVIDDKLTDDLLQHPFLTYDSEDFPEVEDEQTENLPLPSNTKGSFEKQNSEIVEKNQPEKRRVLQESPRIQNKVNKEEQEKKLTSSSKKKKAVANDKAIKSEPFGSKENPKLLTSWIPRVMYENELQKGCNLMFEGKLLNEAGHILNRKFVTDFVLKRHSPTLIETVKNEYFMLVGQLTDTKHVLPKELLKQCRSGCPAKIKEFCDEWKKLKPVLEKPSKIENLHNTSIDHLSLPTSSRGRIILPALNYWNGERTVSKELGVVYEPGDISETSIKIKTPRKFSASSELTQTKKETNVKESNRKSSAKLQKVENKPSNPNSAKKPNKRIAQQSKNSENEFSDKEYSANKKPIVSVPKTPRNEEMIPESTYHTKLRKRQRVDTKQSVPINSETKSRQRKSSVIWSYEKKQDPFDILSDDQHSVIIK